jgi:2-amino-4-hydroxy-6-hydroxymethyldihydropteridine diphosphokinase
VDARLHHLQGKAERLTPVVIALGSNLGDRRAHLLRAAERLTEVLDDIRLSPILETAPVDVLEAQPPYLNAVVVGQCALPPRDLLAHLLTIEAEQQRIRSGWHSPRTLDLDLILYGDVVLDAPDIVVPHPRFRQRAFVLEPLVSVAPDLRDPVTGLTARELLTRLADGASASA